MTTKTATHGGARAGAGRKRKAQVHERAIKKAEKICADRLPQSLENLIKLADGGFEIVDKTFEPAGIVTRDVAKVITDDKGNEKVVKITELAFPEIAALDPTTPVLVRFTVREAGPDRASNVYLIDRIMGGPTQKHEFATLSDAELIEEAKSLFGGDDEAGFAASDAQ